MAALEDRCLLSATLFVDNNPANATQHPGDFTTIQAAVNAAHPGDTIKVAPGFYNEDVVVSTPSLTLIGGQPRLKGEKGPSYVREDTGGVAFTLSANKVIVNGFYITPRPGDDPNANPGEGGITTNAAFSGDQILNNTFFDNTFGLYLNSNGSSPTVVAGNTFDSNVFSEFAPTAVAISGDAIYSDQGLKNANIHNNSFHGDLQAITLIAGNQTLADSIPISNVRIISNTLKNDGAIILVDADNVKIGSDNLVASPNPTAQASGIFFGGAVTHSQVYDTTLQGNPSTGSGVTVRVSDVSAGGAFFIAHDTGGTAIPNSLDTILNNTITGWGFSGIRLQDGSNTFLIQGNTTNNNGSAWQSMADDPTPIYDGITIVDSFSNLVTGNTANHNARNGIRLNNSHDNIVTGNTTNSNGQNPSDGGDGILLENGSNTNTVSNNTSSGNFGAFDVTFGGNGIHVVDSNLNLITGNTANKNFVDGILLAGTSSNNTIRKNVARQNHHFDIEDVSTGTGNTWSQNTFGTKNPGTLS